MAKRQVADLIVGPDVVDLPKLASVQDSVEGIGGVTCIEIATSGRTVSVKDNRLSAGK